MSVLSFILTHKLLVLFIVGTSAFAIATIVLGVENSDLRQQIEDTKIVTTTLPPITTTTPEPPDMDKYRLPTIVIPRKYDLYLYPNLQTGLFKGRVVANVNVKESVNEVVLNSHQLNITRVQIGDDVAKYELDTKYERLAISRIDGGVLPAGNATVTVEFEGDMKNRIVGLYTSTYVNEAKQARSIATSKFEPTYARQAFPCFDEPNMKATYEVHLLKPKDPEYIALSNNPQIREEETSDGILVHFEETVPMSTYLSCFIVSDFKSEETEFENMGKKTKLRVYATPGQLDKTSYAGEVGKKAIEYYIQYFNIPYPLPKLDMVAIPDFVSGAMEHWGLVTYRETALLYNESTHSSANKQRVAEVVAHELAHSWFGNLVTMDWWNNLWLNEGFASYIQYKGVHASEPDWGMADQFLGDLHTVLSLDATQSSHPIIQTVITPDQITEVFDTISYNKGSSVLRMLENVVGEENFRKGVTNYLNKHEYSNAVTQDLWDELQAVVGANINVTEFMDTFTVQMGYPILNIKDNGESFEITQKRFLKDPTSALKGKESPLNYKWSVPIRYITDKQRTESAIFWFNYKQDSLTIPKPTDALWIKFNPSQIGYYRVNYDADHWKKLFSAVNDMSISDRAHLLEETFSIAESGELSYTIPLGLTEYLVNETDYVPWIVASTNFQTIAKYLQDSQSLNQLQKYAISLLQPAYNKYGWDEKSDDEERHLDKLARVVILNLACFMDHPEALQEAGNRFKAWISANEETNSIRPNLRSTIYKYGMVNADQATWELLFERFTQEADANEKLKLMNGLANIRNPVLLTKLIDLAKDETYVRNQDYFTLLQYIAANPIGRPIVWDYVRENWETLVARFTLNDRYLGRLIPGITNSFSTALKVEEMQAFFQKYPDAGAGATARVQALETVNNNIKWLKTHKAAVEEWLETK